MYNQQSANLATQRGTRGLATLFAVVIVLAIAALVVAAVLATSGATKATIGDHSRDIGESARAGAFLTEDRSYDQIEARRAALSQAKHQVAPVTIVKPAPYVVESTDTLRKEHLGVAPAAVPSAPAVSSRDSMESLRLEHMRQFAGLKAVRSIQTWGGGR